MTFFNEVSLTYTREISKKSFSEVSFVNLSVNSVCLGDQIISMNTREWDKTFQRFQCGGLSPLK